MTERSPIQHRMTRRATAHDYTLPGIYHITMHVAEGLGQVLGNIVGNLSVTDGSPDAPRTELTPVGQMVEHELLHSIHAHYPMVSIQDYVIMPEHMHFLVMVNRPIITKSGNAAHLGQVIAGFKKGCNRRYWELQGIGDGQTAAHTVPSGLPAGYKVPSNGSTGRTPLFAAGYCDVMPVDATQLATQRAYIAGNPRSRLQRMSHREWLSPCRGGITTLLTVPALRGYLQRECPPLQATPEVLAEIQRRLLLSDGFIACDSYGNRALLTEHRCLPVVCHRKDGARYNEQKQRCLTEAARGAVLVSPCISPKEREIINENVNHGFPVITIHDNGFPDRYHPSAERTDICAAGRLLLVTPWQYNYRPKDNQINVSACKTMNCLAQALCRKKDNWWKEKEQQVM